jgi:Spy/CpxP family protein refolding chaperone
MFRMTQSTAVLLVGGVWLLAAEASAQGVHAKAAATLTPGQAVTVAPGKISVTASPLNVLNQLTIGDLVSAFQNFVGFGGKTPAGVLQAGLAPQQQQSIQGLQSQLDGQKINEETFASKLHGVLGTAASSRGLGVLGTPLSQPPAAGTSDPLNLTAEQQQAAQDISTQLHDDIAALRQNAHELIFSVLTPDQQAQFSAATAAQTASPAESGTAQTRAPGAGLRSQATSGEASGSGTSVVAQSAADVADAADQTAEAGTPWQTPLDTLQLTDTQKAQIELIRSDLRVAVQARHQQARDEFFAILTPEQQATLYGLEQTSSTAATAEGQ